MNFIVLIFLLVKIFGNITDPITLNIVLFLENNYFTEGTNHAKFEDRNFYYVLIETKCYETKQSKIYTLGTFYPNFEKKNYFLIIDPDMTRDILSAVNLNKENTGFVKFRYLFCEDDFMLYYFSKSFEIKFFEYYENYKKILKGTGDIIKLADSDSDAYLCHIKEILHELCNHKCFILDDLNADLVEQPQKFTFQHFETITSCFDNFKKFVQFLNCLMLDFEKNSLIVNGECFSEQESSSSDSDSFTILGCGSFDSDLSLVNKENLFICKPGSEITDKPSLIEEKSLSKSVNNVLKISYLQEDFQKKFDRDFKDKKEVDEKIKKLYNYIEWMFEAFTHEIIINLSSNDVILPIRGLYTVEFYLDKFYELIKNAIEDMLKGRFDRNRALSTGDVVFRFRLHFKNNLITMYKSIISDAWDSANICDYFSTLFGREIKSVEDFMEVDKVICDYRNMMYSSLVMKKSLRDPLELYFIYPRLVDDLECRIIKGIQITLDHPTRFEQIKAYDETGKELSMRRGHDYFVKFHGRFDKISFSFEKLREKDINVIEIISKDENVKKTFNVKEYLKDF